MLQSWMRPKAMSGYFDYDSYNNKEAKLNISKLRLFIVGTLLSLLFLAILFRIAFLTFPAGKKATKKQGYSRGAIYDRNEAVLAQSKEASTIAIAPSELYDYEQSAEILAQYLETEATEILQKIYEKKQYRYFYLKRQVSNLNADQIMDLNLPGIYREREYSRYYPGQRLASNILGFVGREQDKGLAGIERSFNSTLIYDHEDKEIEAGLSLQLTIDSFLQHHLEQEVEKKWKLSKSKKASAILMDVHSGAILAMVNFPNFNPNQYYKSKPYERTNWNIRFNYEPGSTMKIFMAAILLNEGAVKAKEHFHCKGKLNVFNRVIACKRRQDIIAHGRLTFEEVIANSCNVGIIQAMQRIQAKRIYHYLKELGFGQATQVLPKGSGETQGYLPKFKDWVPSSPYYIPIGHSFSVTPIQLVQAGSALVNGGKLFRPFIAWKILSPKEQRPINEHIPDWKSLSFSQKVYTQLGQIMKLVVKKGTGWRAQLPKDKLQVIGKTGTGQKAKKTGYIDQYVASFLGFFPEKSPKYAALILFDEPEAGYSGGNLAAPTLASFVSKVTDYLQKLEETKSPKR